MRRHKCNDFRTAALRDRKGRRSIVEQVFGETRRRSRRRRAKRDYDEDDESVEVPYGDTYGTLCVRTCDGYYFPVSYSTTKDRFDRDAETCSAMCPGTPAELYYHAVGEEATETMTSLISREPYTSLPAAFAYRQRRSPGCNCKAQKPDSYKTVSGDEVLPDRKAAKKSRFARLATPVFRQDPLLDPETMANRRGSFSSADILSIGRSANVAAAGSAGKQIRIVGGVFFPTQ